MGSVAEAQAAAVAGVDAVIAQGIEAGGRATTTGPAARRGIPIGSFRGPAGELVPWLRYAVGVATADFDGDIEYAPLWAGQSCSVVNDLKPAATLAREASPSPLVALTGRRLARGCFGSSFVHGLPPPLREGAHGTGGRLERVPLGSHRGSVLPPP